MTRNHSFKITGYLVGPIWWPSGSECWKDLDYDLSSEDARFTEPGTLRDHILRATNDGDFQNCSIAHGELVATRCYRRGERTVREVRSWPLERFPSIADCLHDDLDWFPDCRED